MRAILTFQGFTESDAERTGTENLYWTVIREFSSGLYVTTDWPRTWTSDVEKLVALISRQGIRHVALVSYSHGQAAACAFARMAYDYGVHVDLWLACDPVYRPTWLPRWNWLQPLSFRALMKRGRIVVPDSVRRVVWAKQEISLPRGHDLVAEVPKWTHIEPPLILNYSHTAIDEAPEWFALVRRELRDWCNPPKANLV